MESVRKFISEMFLLLFCCTIVNVGVRTTHGVRFERYELMLFGVDGWHMGSFLNVRDGA